MLVAVCCGGYRRDVRAGCPGGIDAGPRRGGLLGAVVRAVPRARADARKARRGVRWEVPAGESEFGRKPGAVARFNVRSIPDVRVFRDGRQSISSWAPCPRQLRAFIDNVVPSPAELERRARAGAHPCARSRRRYAALVQGARAGSGTPCRPHRSCEMLVETGRHEEAAIQLEKCPMTRIGTRESPRSAGGRVRPRRRQRKRSVGASSSESADLEARLALAGALAARRSGATLWTSCWKSSARQDLARWRSPQADDRDLQPRAATRTWSASTGGTRSVLFIAERRLPPIGPGNTWPT
jgi:hypothetical protein